MGDTGTPQLCLRDVDMDLTRIGKLSLSISPSNSIVSGSCTPSDAVIPFAVSIDPNSPFRFIVKLSSTAGSRESPLSMIQLGSNLGLSWVTTKLWWGSSAGCIMWSGDGALTWEECVVREVCAGRFSRDTCRPTVGVLLSGTVDKVDAVESEAGIPPSKSLKYSESLREELKPSRSSTLLLTSPPGQS